MRALAALVGGGLPLRPALETWATRVGEPERSILMRVSRRLRLGDTIEGALRAAEPMLGGDLGAVSSALALHARLGGDAARTLEGLASAVNRRDEMEQAGRAAAAGTRLSGRIVAGLPLLAVPSLPFAHVPFTDGIGVLLVLAGAGLALSGLLWMERLTPRPPGEDSGAAFADLTGVVLSSGLPLQAALAAVAGGCSPALGSAVRRAQRLTRLGASWPQALALSGDDALMAVGEVTRHALAAGRPVAEALEGLAARRRRARAAAFEMELRRAPVLMVIPLTLLILPSYVLLVLAPFLRGM